MNHQGSVLDLADFEGTITIHDNTFSNIQFGFDSCEKVAYADFTESSSDIWIIDGNTHRQFKTALYVNVRSSEVEIYSNTFTNCNSMYGLLWVTRKSDYETPILIDGNTFTNNSAIDRGANVMVIDLFTDQNYDEEFTDENMICANLQISNNIFTNNIGCFSTTGVMAVSCYTAADSSLQNTRGDYKQVTPMYNDTSLNLQKLGIVEFSQASIVIMADSGKEMDKNKFLMANNTFEGNFAGYDSVIVHLQGIRRVHIQGDVYRGNTCIFAEALHTFGTLETAGYGIQELLTYDPGAYTFDPFYLDSIRPTSFLPGTSEEENDGGYNNYVWNQMYSDGILLIDSAFYIMINDTTFDNNYFAEEEVGGKLDDRARSLALTISRSQGELYLGSVKIQNYFGWDLSRLETTLGEDAFDNVTTFDPTERDINGSPYTPPTSPQYAIDYGFKGQLIALVRPTYSSEEDFQNYFDKIEINSLTIENITQYTAGATVASVFEILDDCLDLSISNLDVNGVDLILSSAVLFELRPLGPMLISGGNIRNINREAFMLDYTYASYLSTNGSFFKFSSFNENSLADSLVWEVENLEMSYVYGAQGGAFYLSKRDENSGDPHNITLLINNVTISNSLSTMSGVFFASDSHLEVVISNSLFSENIGIG